MARVINSRLTTVVRQFITLRVHFCVQHGGFVRLSSSLCYDGCCVFVAAASNVKSSVSSGQLYVLKMERAECERLLNIYGKQRQYVVRESKKVYSRLR